MNQEEDQPWLFPEVGASIDEYRSLGYGKRKEGDVYKVPEIVMGPEVRNLVKDWPVEISSRRVRIIKPYAQFAELEPRDLFNFKNIQGLGKMEFAKVDNQTIKITYDLRGSIREEYLILHQNGTVEHKWL